MGGDSDKKGYLFTYSVQTKVQIYYLLPFWIDILLAGDILWKMFLAAKKQL